MMVKISKAHMSWRLVHDTIKVIELFESRGITKTVNELFTGTEKECLAEVERLKLKHKIEVIE